MAREDATITVTPRSFEQQAGKFAKSGKKAKADITRLLIWAGNEARNRTVNSMASGRRDKGPSGMLYPSRVSNKMYRASAPGEPPAVDSGELLRSIVFEQDDLSVTIGSRAGAPYSEDLEFGNRYRNLKPRPFLGPAAAAVEPLFMERLRKIVGRIGE